MTDLQKAGIWKRISAFILDAVLLCVVAVGCAYIISAITGFDSANQKLSDRYTYYEQTYGINFKITEEEYSKLPEEDKEKYDETYKLLLEDDETINAYSLVVNLVLLISSLGIFLAFLILEFIVPVILKNGQTVGKKVFSLGVMKVSGIRLSPVTLFVRSILGKYAIEVMVPLYVFFMIIFNGIGIIGIAVLGALLILQVGLLLGTQLGTPIHDLLAGTVVIELSSQMIFETEEERNEYIRREAAERAAREEY